MFYYPNNSSLVDYSTAVQVKQLLVSSYKIINFTYNHNYNKIVKSDWLSTALISALIGQFNRTVRVMPK